VSFHGNRKGRGKMLRKSASGRKDKSEGGKRGGRGEGGESPRYIISKGG